MTMNTTTQDRYGLTAYAARWKAAMRAGDQWALLISHDVINVATHWESYRAEAEGLDCSVWLQKALRPGCTLRFFQDRADAVAKLGEASRRVLHHEVAVWLANHVEGEEQIRKAMWALMSATKRQNGNCLTLSQAKPRVYAALGVEPSSVAKPCERCAQLERLLRENGIEVPE